MPLSARLLAAPVLAGLLAVSSPQAAWAVSGSYAFGPSSTITYKLVHPMHRVTGVSHALDGRVELANDKLVTPLTLKLPVTTFKSGNANRDNNAAFALGAGPHPFALLEVTRFSETQRSAVPGGQKVAGTATGRLTLRGVSRNVELPLEATLDAAGLTVDAAFAVKLTDYQIERPSLMFVPVEDSVQIVVHAVAASAKR